MFFKKIILPIFFIAVLLATSGCSGSTDGKAEQKDQEKEQARVESVLKEFHSLTAEGGTIKQQIQFIDDNIKTLPQEAASEMILSLEKNLMDYQPVLEEKYWQEEVQSGLFEAFTTGIDINKGDLMKDPALKDLLNETRASGFKIETAEGTFFPIINYEMFKQYTPRLTPDIQEYLNIMAEESNQAPAKDAALVIGWEEVLQRALKQEKFIADYKESKKVNDIKQLYKKYMTFTYYGANNTPLFDYDTNTLNSKAKSVYLNAVKNNGSSVFLNNLSVFLDIAKKNDYKLTGEVEKYRENILKDLGE
ncbi:hypothetical protein [Desulforamulus ruminis]|uniref:Lipoprotein n=1 Tax=Desulforamulus ruminis (strain ATCC 23193 / DSM 2154 / NCIMB 8452 / DL) TaxID=696281 RepID=F6DUI8_DESRL|nr:hypothetical protein [Desulforamulus ruminis]AEG59055.1 hypothetical protein Desru_0772 [Desulforamulus ruminis DSM 2154]